MPDMKVTLGSLTLNNPVLAASGTFGFGREYSSFFPLNMLGALVAKGITLVPRAGSMPPRLRETPAGLLNSVGLQNPGLENFIREELPFMKQAGVTVIANVAGETIEEYEALVEGLLNASHTPAAVELNVSCPNVARGCFTFGADPESLYQLVSRIKRSCPLPLIVKLTPNDIDITETARAAEAAGADILSLINTLKGMVIDTEKKKPFFQREIAGLSGPAIRPVAVRMVWDTFKAVKIPIIGMGGIINCDDALQFIMAGAKAVAVGSGNFIDPLTIPRLVQDLRIYLETQGYTSIAELWGIAHR